MLNFVPDSLLWSKAWIMVIKSDKSKDDEQVIIEN
jgi:hypothetical protein